MVKLAEVEVTQRDLYNVADRSPVKHGVLDLRLVSLCSIHYSRLYPPFVCFDSSEGLPIIRVRQRKKARAIHADNRQKIVPVILAISSSYCLCSTLDTFVP